MALARYHVMIDQVRTTVSLTPVLAELLALKLGTMPQTQAARAALCSWLQAEIDRDPGAVRYGQAILTVAAPSLISKRDDWMEQKRG